MFSCPVSCNYLLPNSVYLSRFKNSDGFHLWQIHFTKTKHRKCLTTIIWVNFRLLFLLGNITSPIRITIIMVVVEATISAPRDLDDISHFTVFLLRNWWHRKILNIFFFFLFLVQIFLLQIWNFVEVQPDKNHIAGKKHHHSKHQLQGTSFIINIWLSDTRWYFSYIYSSLRTVFMKDSNTVHVWNSGWVCAKRYVFWWKIQSSVKATHKINHLVHGVLILTKKKAKLKIYLKWDNLWGPHKGKRKNNFPKLLSDFHTQTE